MLLFVNCKAQTIVDINTYNQGDNSNKYFKDLNNNFTDFIGTWEYTSGTTTFRVVLWKEAKRQLLSDNNSFIDNINGKFLIIENLNMINEEIVCNSIRFFSESNQTPSFVIQGKAGNNYIASGSIEDNCVDNGNSLLNGFFTITISNLGSTPLSAHWVVKSERPLNTGESFTIPTDCILIKQ